MKNYFYFIKPRFIELVYLDAVFLILVILKMLVSELNWIYVFSGHAVFLISATIVYFYSKSKKYID
jgi:hypothetical protein